MKLTSNEAGSLGHAPFSPTTTPFSVFFRYCLFLLFSVSCFFFFLVFRLCNFLLLFFFSSSSSFVTAPRFISFVLLRRDLSFLSFSYTFSSFDANVMVDSRLCMESLRIMEISRWVRVGSRNGARRDSFFLLSFLAAKNGGSLRLIYSGLHGISR